MSVWQFEKEDIKKTKRMGSYVQMILLCFFLGFCFSGRETLAAEDAAAQKETDEFYGESAVEELLKETEISFEEIEEYLKNSSIGGRISFEEIVTLFWQGETSEAYGKILQWVKEAIFSEFYQNRKHFIQIILLAVIAALFTNIGSGMFSSSLQQTGFYAAYLAMAGVVLASFSLMQTLTEETLVEILSFMEVFLPAYAIVITMVCGSVSSAALYEVTFLLVKGCEWALKFLFLPLIETYMMIEMINCILETDRFGSLGNLIKKGTKTAFKWLSGMVLGLSLIQNMILPAVDSVKTGIWLKGMAAIPGAGDVISGMMNSLFGAAVLIKNSIGAGCLLILVFLCALPVVKLAVFIGTFSVCAAFLQPISDKRLIRLLNITGETGKLLLELLMTGLTLFFIIIALAAISTNGRYYAS